jgi:hypothetical protein
MQVITTISSRTNSPACVEGDLPSRLSLRAFSIVFFSGIVRLPLCTDSGRADFSDRSCRCAGFSAAAAGCLKPRPRRLADSQEHICRRGLRGHSRAQRSTNIATTIGAGPHRNHIPRLGHLVIDPAQRWRHFVAQRAGNNQEIGVAWRSSWGHAEPLHVVARHRRLHHFDRAAGEAKGVPHERSRSRPLQGIID